MLTTLEFWDFVWIALIVTLFAGGSAAYASRSRTSDSSSLRRIEAKLDLILKQLGIDYVDTATPAGLSEEVRVLARDPSQKLAAIRLHREQTGLGLEEAKDAVEAYIAGESR